MTTNRKVIVYIAMSLDGYIAKSNDDLSFLSVVEQEGNDYGYTEFVKTIDTVIIGRKTYDWVMKRVPVFPHHDKETFVITRTARPSDGSTNFYSGNVKDLVETLKEKEGKNIFIDGGAEIVNMLLKFRIIDEFIISVIPILVGDGTRLFANGAPEQNLKLIDTQQFDTGLLQLYYRVEP